MEHTNFNHKEWRLLVQSPRDGEMMMMTTTIPTKTMKMTTKRITKTTTTYFCFFSPFHWIFLVVSATIPLGKSTFLKSRKQETLNLATDADSSTDTETDGNFKKPFFFKGGREDQ